MLEPNVQIYKKAGGTCACVPVCLSLQLWFRGNNNNHDQEKKRKALKLASFTLERKEQTNNGAGRAEHRSSLVQEAN